MPLYSLADRSAMAAIRHRAPQLPVTPWINYFRVPAALSALLLLVWFPLILRLKSPYHASSALSADPYVWHWLAVTGALFGLSAVLFALRLRRGPRTALAPERPAAPAGATAEAEGKPRPIPRTPAKPTPASPTLARPTLARNSRQPSWTSGNSRSGHLNSKPGNLGQPKRMPGRTRPNPRPHSRAPLRRIRTRRARPSAAAPRDVRPYDTAPDAD